MSKAFTKEGVVGRRVGDATTLHTPGGDEELTVTSIDFEPASPPPER